MAAPATRYTALFPVGRGGMGSVSVALEQGELGFRRIVAQKRLLPEIGKDARHKAMFLREAKLAALLCHPNVVRAFDAGEHGGELFLTMEYVAGQTLATALDRLGSNGERLPIAVALHVLAELCDGLHAAHELRDVDGRDLAVVHRDVSPHNVMLGYDGSVKLLDFGVAKIEAESNATRTGEVKGKVAYMSPEQAMGDPLDRRSDLYAIGALLYECLTGARMWGNGTEMEMMRKLALGSPPRLADAFDAAPTLVATLDALHATLVASKPDARPASADAVARAIRTAMAAASLAGSQEDVGALVHRLFATEEEEAKAALAKALDHSTNAREAVPAAPLVVESPPPRRRPFAPLAIAGAAIAVLVGGLVVLRRPTEPAPPIASSTRPATALETATAATASVTASAATATAIASAPPSPKPTARASKGSTGFSPKPPPSAAVPATAKAPSPVTAPPTVDEHPF